MNKLRLKNEYDRLNGKKLTVTSCFLAELPRSLTQMYVTDHFRSRSPNISSSPTSLIPTSYKY